MRTIDPIVLRHQGNVEKMWARFTRFVRGNELPRPSFVQFVYEDAVNLQELLDEERRMEASRAKFNQELGATLAAEKLATPDLRDEYVNWLKDHRITRKEYPLGRYVLEFKP